MNFEINDLFIKYCDRHKIGNAYLDISGEVGVVAEKGITRFSGINELVTELKW